MKNPRSASEVNLPEIVDDLICLRHIWGHTYFPKISRWRYYRNLERFSRGMNAVKGRRLTLQDQEQILARTFGCVRYWALRRETI
jgi:hypothetical protein